MNFRYRRIGFFGLLMVIAIIIVAWLYNTSYVAIRVSGNGGASDIIYTLTGQGSRKSTIVKTASSSVKVRVHRGSYELNVEQADKSYFIVLTTRGFLSKTDVSAPIQEEAGRSFVGNSPGPCVNYVGSQLLSYTCGGAASNITVHAPATSTTPTYGNKVSIDKSGYIENAVSTSDGLLALIENGAAGGGYSLYDFDNNLRLVSTTQLASLDSSKQYLIKSYGKAFAIFDTSFSQALYYSSAPSAPRSIQLAKPKDGSLVATSLDFTSNGYLAMYANNDETGNKLERSEVMVNRSGNTQDYVFNQNFSDASFCGSADLCALADNNLEVYNISGSQPIPLFKVGGVDGFDNSTGKLLIVNKVGVLNLDVSSRSGYYSYTFGSYKFDSLQSDYSGRYILTLTNPKSSEAALLIDPATVNSGSIDKKIIQLMSRPEVQNVSAYKQFIYISPNFGKLTYQSSIGGYGPDPSTLTKVNDEIKSDIAAAGIDTSRYVIVNPYDEL